MHKKCIYAHIRGRYDMLSNIFCGLELFKYQLSINIYFSKWDNKAMHILNKLTGLSIGHIYFMYCESSSIFVEDHHICGCCYM